MEDKKITHIIGETSLPKESKGIISYIGDPLELAEKNRKDMMAWEAIDPNNKNADQKMVWLLAVKTAFNSPAFAQLEKNAIAEGYKILRKATIEPNLLNMLYDRRMAEETQKASSNDSIVIGLFEVILNDALNQDVSDIHIEVRNTGAHIRMRKHGELMEYRANNRLRLEEAKSLCSVLYNVLASQQDVTFDISKCQSAAIDYTLNGTELKLRYQSVNANLDGFDVILRILPIGRSEEFTPLQKLGYTEQQVQELVGISSRPVGALIIAGITGSGKSTTLKNLLMFINANSGYRLKIYTIEDPVEYTIAKVTQIPVNIPKDYDPTKDESPFAKPIKACMRADPDLIMIGEVRDHTSADLTKKAVQSGHQVLTTVHATSALGIIERFIDFGLTRSVLGSPEFLTGLIYQKLLPTVCKNCSIDFNKHIHTPEATQKDLDVYRKLGQIVNPEKYPLRIRHPEGCIECSGQGITGRSVAAEVITLDLKMIQFIATGQIIPLIIYWRGLSDKNPASENMKGKTCMEHGFQKVLAGLVSPHDLETSFKPLDEMLLKAEDVEIGNHKKLIANLNTKLDPASDHHGNQQSNDGKQGWQNL